MLRESLPHQLTAEVKLLHKIALVVAGRVLILRRSPSSRSRPRLWDLPGGNAEWPTVAGSALREGLHRQDISREIEEETGIHLSDEQRRSLQAPLTCHTYFEPRKPLYSIVLGWTLPLSAQPNIRLSAEHTAFYWLAWAEWAEYDFGFAGEEGGFLRQLIESSLVPVQGG